MFPFHPLDQGSSLPFRLVLLDANLLLSRLLLLYVIRSRFQVRKRVTLHEAEDVVTCSSWIVKQIRAKRHENLFTFQSQKARFSRGVLILTVGAFFVQRINRLLKIILSKCQNKLTPERMAMLNFQNPSANWIVEKIWEHFRPCDWKRRVKLTELPWHRPPPCSQGRATSTLTSGHVSFKLNSPWCGHPKYPPPQIYMYNPSKLTQMPSNSRIHFDGK